MTAYRLRQLRSQSDLDCNQVVKLANTGSGYDII